MFNRLSLALIALLALSSPAHAVLDDVHQWSVTPASNTDVGGISLAEGMQRASVNNAMREMMAEIRRGVAGKGTDISSVGGTPAICATGTSSYVDITGTTTITSFGTANAGCWRILQFDGALTITHNATSLILPSAANITTAAGDVLGVISEGSGNWRAIFFSRVPYLSAANTFTAAQTIQLTAAGTALTATSTDAGASGGPRLALHRDSASPAASDEIGGILMNGEDSASNATTYGRFRSTIIDATDTSEDGAIQMLATVAGAETAVATFSDGVLLGSPTGSYKGAGTLNASAGLYIAGHGTVAQQVVDTEAAYTDLGAQLPFDDSIPQNTEGDEVMTAAITPINASSVLYIDVTAHLGGNTGETQSCALFVDSTAGALAAGSTIMTNTTTMNTITFRHSVSAASTSARTYKVRCGSSTTTNGKLNGDSTARRFGGVAISSLTVTEVLPQ